MGILSGPEIGREYEEGNIVIDPFNADHINPASIDLTLGKEFAVYNDWVHVISEREAGPEYHHRIYSRNDVIDSKKEPTVRSFDISKEGLQLMPGILYLMHTEERVHTEKYVPVLDGKSSIGRLGIIIHLTAGFGDPGFDGQYTLEVTCVHPVRVYPGMRFCQMRFHALVGEVLNYQKTGHYKGEAATGPVPSQAFRQFGDS